MSITNNAINSTYPVGVASGGLGTSSLTADAVIVTNGTSPVSTVTLGSAQLLIGSTGATPVAATLTQGSNVTITNADGSITIAASSGAAWVDQTSTSVTMAAHTSYVADSASLITFSLPASPTLGDEYRIVSKGAGGWTIAVGEDQVINFGVDQTSISLSSTAAGDAVYLVYISAEGAFQVLSAQGNLAYA